MAPTTLAERLAELLGLPVEVILAYGRPKTSVAFRRVRKPGAVIDTGQPSSRLMTLKDTAQQPDTIEAEKITPTKTDDNELHKQWREASDDQKPELEKPLYDSVLKHVRAVIWLQLEEQNADLAQNIAAAVIMRLHTFRGKSKFSTWVEGIARKQIKQELRRRTRSQECNLENIERVRRTCQYVPMAGKRMHLIVVDEADRMTDGAQVSLLSKLDSTNFPPNTIFVFTSNDSSRLEPRFLSRLSVLEFSSYGIAKEAAELLAKVWDAETDNPIERPNFARIVKDSNNNVREALNRLQVEIMMA